LGVIVLWSVVTVGMLRSGLNLFDSRPLSFIGVATESALLFNAGLTVAALLFLYFGFQLSKRYKLKQTFLVFLTVGQLAQIVAAIFPYGGDYKTIHTYAAFTLAVMIPFYMRAFAKSDLDKKIKRPAQLFYRAELLFAVIGIGAFIFIEGISPASEILPALPFHGWILYLFYKTKNTPV
jgi:hypothetical membrane protein